MNEKILNALRCPKTGAALALQPAQAGLPEGLLSAQANLLYPIRDGIPILLIEQAIDVSAVTDLNGVGRS